MAAMFPAFLFTLACWWCASGLSSARSLRSIAYDSVGDRDSSLDAASQNRMTSYVGRCDVAGCHYDTQLYCLDNGVIVVGSCALKNMLCTDGERNALRLAERLDMCFQATYLNVIQDQRRQVSADLTSQDSSTYDLD